MTVPDKPFWLSQANSEFEGNGWASNILEYAFLSTPGLLGDLAGKSSMVSIIGRPGSPIGENQDGMAYFWRTGNDIWSGGTGIPDIQLTSGMCEIRIRYTGGGGSGTMIFSGVESSVAFIPDETKRGFGCLHPDSPGDVTVTAAIDFISKGAVVETMYATARSVRTA
ncbi:hypothetical protein [Aeromonas enteropelogenes]|uniref:Uncharacterized protein n=1 Tax=Aeromonas enteropelogenes TaxID=29489 RepID=A0ABU9J8U3_AEREN